MAAAPDGSIWVVEKGGRVVSFSRGATGELREGAVILDVSDRVAKGLEQGLLGLAIDESRGWAYVDFIDSLNNTLVEAYRLTDDGGVDEQSARELFRVHQPFANHNGGQLALGPDGLLYIGLGDGGGTDDPEKNAQDSGSYLGKILRIAPTPGANEPYQSPASNPFAGLSGGRAEVYLFGVRNPWRFSFDADGALWVADVGQREWEELNYFAPGAGLGANLGWPRYEGQHEYEGDPLPRRVDPVYEYNHVEGRCSIVGGVVGGASSPAPGVYFFGDWCSGEIWGLRAGEWDVVVELGKVARVSAFGQVDDDVYALSTDGGIFRAVARAATPG